MKNLLLISLFIILLPINSISQEEFWINLSIPDSVEFEGLVHLGSDTLFATSDHGVYITYDDGLSWEQNGLAGIELKDIFRAPNNDIFVSNHIDIWVSKDRGNTWEDLNASIMSGFPVRIFVDSNNVMYVSGNGNVCRSYNYWQTFDTVLEYLGGAPKVSRVAQNPVTKELYVGYTDYISIREGLWGSPNGDPGTWEVKKADPDFVSTITCSPDGKVYVGTIGHFTGFYTSLYVSDDNCLTWNRMYYECVDQIVAPSVDNLYISCKSTPGIFFKNQNDSVFIDITNNLASSSVCWMSMFKNHLYVIQEHWLGKSIEPISNSKIKNSRTIQENNLLFYPNPATDFINISLPKTFQGNITINIYNVHGELLERFSSSQKLIKHSLHNLSEGVYFIELSDSISKVVKKIIVMH